jgi:NADH dehydrogenase
MILVTGGGGYVGSHLVRRLAESGEQVRALVRNQHRVAREGRIEGLPVEIVEGDVTIPQSLPPAFDGVQSVVHTVAIAIEKGGRTYEQVNYQGTVNVVDAAQSAGVRRFINLSQLGADSTLSYRFLASKGRAQDHVAASRLEWTALRPSVIWGPEDEFANTFARLIPFSPLIFPIVGDESSKFEVIWVEDVTSSILKALSDSDTIGREYELGGPEILTLEEIERRTLAAVGASRAMVRFPMPLLRVIVTLMEALLPAPPVTRSLLEMLAVSNVTKENSIQKFVPNPRPFTPENVSSYMTNFRISSTVRQFLGRS